MTEIEAKPVGPHPAALLLPWYVNGTLNDQERRDVQAHLAGCADCSRELAELTDLREMTHAHFNEAPGPSAQARRSVMAQLSPKVAQVGLLDRLALLFQELLAPKWAPAALSLIVVGQFAGLGWLATRTDGVTTPTTLSRAVPAAAVRLKILFNPTVPTGTLQSALHELGGHIVDGPTVDGAFIIELAPDDPKLISSRIRILKGRPDLIQSIESAPP